MCSETSEAVGTIWEHAQLEFQKFLKIRITLMEHLPLVLQFMRGLELTKEGAFYPWLTTMLLISYFANDLDHSPEPASFKKQGLVLQYHEIIGVDH